MDTAEYNPTEFINTNIIGSRNIVDVSLRNPDIKNVVALSTDKAVSPSNLYGATKLCSDKLFIATNNYKGKNIKFSVVRYGNVLSSRGSVVPLFKEQLEKGLPFTITSKNMTRFNILLKDAAKMVYWVLKNNLGGEVFIPKLKCYNILDLAKSIDKKHPIKFIGIRPGEKLHEEMFSKEDSTKCVELKNFYVLLNDFALKKYSKQKKLKYTKLINGYSSSNGPFLSISELKKLI